VYTGEDMHGDVLSEGVKERILKCDGLLGFRTRRGGQHSDGTYSSHDWVRDELVFAISNGIKAVEIRDNLVDAQGGMIGDRQRIPFDLDKKELLLVEIARCLSALRKKIKARRLQLLPEAILADARKHIRANSLECTYQFLTGNKESALYKVRPIPVGQGLCVDIQGIPSDESLVQIILKGPDFEWFSGYEYIHMLPIALQKSQL
jgi:hypothetical protein